ncbi:hypothetical protein CWE08_01165 [Aliidiomarina iranensis]|uniref:DUF6671 domain-containing protein n=1 Tax=Aliidiomarina iranensis TaxID=1434071 RepID=A0A432W251_9GAMM|nr:DUF6671 family protein [Aliidiomarina iranensis]RUO23291.1 hypothetical protein CWE08_01165 [Aliidiomarina iranensis]
MAFAILVTQHEKGKLIAPVLQEIGIRVVENSSWDTDQLGTFAGEVERRLTPHECALEKAKQAIKLTGLGIGLGSEGSFGGGPLPGVINWNEEILCFYQPEHERVIYARASGAFPGKSFVLEQISDLEHVEELSNQGLHWIVKINDEILKGLNLAMLTEALTIADQHGLLTWPIKVEPDLRAMYCPPRQQMIKKAAEDLARRLQALCPECSEPNFVVKHQEKGLPCELCSLPTQLPSHEVLHCEACEHTEKLGVAATSADSQHCQWCNP